MADVKPDTPPVSAAEIKKLEDRLARQRDAFKTQTIASISDLVSQLADIGFEYELVEKGNAPSGKKNKCGNCGEGGHSARTCPNPKKQ